MSELSRSIGTMSSTADLSRTHALIDELFGPTDAAADRSVAVIHAQAAALAWVRDVTGVYPAPTAVAAELDRIAKQLRSADDDRDPVAVLGQAAVDALATYRASAAA
jgi:hypothetical protein